MSTDAHAPRPAATSDRSATSHRQAQHLPGALVGDLLGGALGDNDPSMRDYGDRYEYRGVIGEGGQGVVLSVRDRLLEREVALKALKGKPDRLREETIDREARIAGALEHPNIPPTYDLGRDESGSPFFVMRKVEGVTLDEILRQRRRHAREHPSGTAGAPDYSRQQLLYIFLQVCHAIEFAHARGVLHLDIKPQNVRLGNFGEVFVLDWGFAARKDEVPTLVGGTPIYIAPEILRKEAPDERADVYSLGVLLYRILTGERPYDVRKLSFRDYCKRFDSLVPIPPRSRDRSIPPELEAIVFKAMAKYREDRYASVRALATDLQRFLDGRPVSVYRHGPALRVLRFLRRHAPIAILVSLLLAALVGTAFATYRIRVMNDLRQRNRASEEARELARQHRENRRARARIPFQKARDFLDKSPPLLEGARRYFSRALSIDNRYAEAFFERGKVHMRLGHPQEALADFRQALALEPETIMAHYYAGTILMDVEDLRDYRAAALEFQAMQEIDPGNEFSNVGLARLHLLGGRHGAALELCDRIEESNPYLNDVHYLRARVYETRGGPFYDPARAIESYDRYLATADDNASAWLNRGDLRRRQGDEHGALEDYNRALEINPDYVWALNNRGWIRYASRDPEIRSVEAALEDFNRAAAARPEYYWTYMNRGAVYEYLQRWTRAEEEYNWALDLKPDSAIVHQRRAQCFFRQRKLPEALAGFNAALEAAPADQKPTLLHRRALVHIAAGRDAEALADLDRALALNHAHPLYPALHRHFVLLRQGRPSDPTSLQVYADLETDRPWLGTVVLCLRGLLDPDDAATRAADLSPEAASELLYYVGMYRLIVGHDPAGARKLLEKCVAQGVHLYNEYVLAQAQLERLAEVVPAPNADAPGGPDLPATLSEDGA